MPPGVSPGTPPFAPPLPAGAAPAQAGAGQAAAAGQQTDRPAGSRSKSVDSVPPPSPGQVPAVQVAAACLDGLEEALIIAPWEYAAQVVEDAHRNATDLHATGKQAM